MKDTHWSVMSIKPALCSDVMAKTLAKLLVLEIGCGPNTVAALSLLGAEVYTMPGKKMLQIIGAEKSGSWSPVFVKACKECVHQKQKEEKMTGQIVLAAP
jgi:hypothetical protein